MHTTNNKGPQAQIPVRCVEGVYVGGCGEGRHKGFRLRRLLQGFLVAERRILCILYYIYTYYLSPWVKVAKVGLATIYMSLSCLGCPLALSGGPLAAPATPPSRRASWGSLGRSGSGSGSGCGCGCGCGFGCGCGGGRWVWRGRCCGSGSGCARLEPR